MNQYAIYDILNYIGMLLHIISYMCVCVCVFNAIKFPIYFFKDIEKPIPKFMQNHKGTQYPKLSLAKRAMLEGLSV